MKLLVFGATGGTGQALVSQGLEQGHQVTAYVRNPAAVASREGLTVVQGDVTNVELVTKAIAGQDVVLSTLGSRGGPEGVIAEGARNIIAGMSATGVRRLIYVTSFGVGDSLEQMGWFARTVVVGMFLKKALAEKELEEQAIRSSSVDWTIVRPGSLEDGPKTGSYRCVTDPSEKLGRPRIARADVADFMLKNLSSDQFIRKAVGLTY